MLKRLISFSLEHASLVLMLAGLLLAVAAVRTPDMPVDVFPELNAPTVVIMTESPGLATGWSSSIPISRSQLGAVRRVVSAGTLSQRT